MSALVSDMMKRFLEEAAQQYDWVVLDTPPVALLSDANLLAVDDRPGDPRRRRQQHAVSAGQTRRRGARPLEVVGVVLNRAERSELSSGYGYYGYKLFVPVTRRSPRSAGRFRSTEALSTRMFFKTWRSIVLVLGETACSWQPSAAGTVRASRRLRRGTCCGRTDGFLKALLDRRRSCQVCLHYADLYDLRGIVDRRDLSIAPHPGARRHVADSRGRVFLVSRSDHRPRRVPRRRGAGRSLVVRAGASLFAWLTQACVAHASGCCSSAPSPAAVDLARELSRAAPGAWRRDRRLRRSRSGAASAQPVINPGVVGTIDDIPLDRQRCGVDRVVVSLADARGKLPMDKLLDMRLRAA